MTKEEKAEHIKRNPKTMYLGFAGIFALMALFFFGLAQVQDQPTYLPYDKSTRPYIWMCIMLACSAPYVTDGFVNSCKTTE